MRMPRAGVLAACVIVALGVAACGDDEGSSNGPLSEIAKADDEDGVRFRLSATLQEGGERSTLRGYGQAEADGKRTRIVIAEDGESVEVISAEPYVYLRSSLDGPDWARTKDKGDDEDLAGLLIYAHLTPSAVPELLDAIDPAMKRAGSERVDGVQTTRYRFEAKGEKLSEEIGERVGLDTTGVSKTATFGFVLWVDRDKRVRRARMRAVDKDESLTVTSQVTRYDRGLKLDLPSGRDVKDVSEQDLI